MRRQTLSTESTAPSKTVGSRTAQLMTTLYESDQTTFSHADVESITGLPPASARSLIRHAVARGVVSRLEPGLFVLVPPELGRATEFAGNPYIVARQLVAGSEYFISHASAMELHRMVTQPQLVVFTSTTKRLRNRTIHGTEFRFVLVRREDAFGVTTHWVSKQESVKISDIERTVIDGLHLPTYCGGITEVAKGLWMRRDDVKAGQLIDYALRLGVGAVVRRLGYLLDFYQIAPPEELDRLRRSLSATYAMLDPMLPAEGAYVSGWRLRVNVAPDEFEAIRRT
ncbi:MAG: transcriptional regulator [Acidobacteria bacterium]|nr:transcriptional regulator [Acidobacteriota bacterium]